MLIYLPLRNVHEQLYRQEKSFQLGLNYSQVMIAETRKATHLNHTKKTG